MPESLEDFERHREELLRNPKAWLESYRVNHLDCSYSDAEIELRRQIILKETERGKSTSPDSYNYIDRQINELRGKLEEERKKRVSMAND